MIAISSIVRSRAWSITLASFLILAIGVLDYFTGRECQVVALYLLPVSLVVWAAGRRWGIAFSVLAALTWLAAELGSGEFFAFKSSPFWNASMFLTVFLAVTLLLSALHDMMNSLERRVRIRTGQLREEMTRRHDAELARLRAERLALVGSMAAQMAHEVRNPMSSVALNLDLLSDELGSLTQHRDHPSDEATLLVGQIQQELGRIENVLRDYLSFARLPKVTPQLKPLHPFLDEMLALVLPELKAARIRLAKDYDPHIHAVNMDPVQLWQVILNLVRNAREAMPDGGEIHIRTQAEDGSLQITVSDSGQGIRQEDLASLFTPFFTTKAQGTGLGLALSQQIVTEHGGLLTCQSTVGVGTTFAITLPYAGEAAHSHAGGFNIPPLKPNPNPHPREFHELRPATSSPG